jgi:two-component system CheB/CheR fusion protein
MPKPPGQATIDAPGLGGEREVAALRAELAQVRAELVLANIAVEASRVRAGELDAELQHRVRNILAVVRSIFQRTVESADTVDSVAGNFQGRIDALARYQLRAISSDGYDLEEMVHDTLITYAVLDDPRVTVAGPEVRLSGRTAESISLVLHELTTNAVKFGMLSGLGDRGTLAIRWTMTRGLLSFEWAEGGIAIISSAPRRTGFGRNYIEQGLPYQLGGKSRFELTPGRLRCTFVIPLIQHENSVDREQSAAFGVNDT